MDAAKQQLIELNEMAMYSKPAVEARPKVRLQYGWLRYGLPYGLSSHRLHRCAHARGECLYGLAPPGTS